eukprot:1445652-Alexandrium_andersonii.AAC.1
MTVTESAPSSRRPSSAAPLSRQTSGPLDRATAATTTMESDLQELRGADIGGRRRPHHHQHHLARQAGRLLQVPRAR